MDSKFIRNIGRFCALALVLKALEPAAKGDFFVATNGNDSWTGRLSAPNSARTDGPFASVAKAQAAIQDFLKDNPGRAVAVMVRGGTTTFH